MGMDKKILAVAKQYTDESIEGITGTLAGKNCIIESCTKANGRTTVIFKWTADNGDVKRTTMIVQDGTPIYEWTSGDHYEYGDLCIYASCFYRCITPNDDIAFDATKWNEIGSPDGNYDIVQNGELLPTIFTAADRKMYYSIEDGLFYLWNGLQWVLQRPKWSDITGKPTFADVATSGSYDDLEDKPTIPSKTSDLANDSNFVADANYVHTDNNYNNTAKGIVDGIDTALSGKVDKVTGKGLSENDYTNADKAIVDGVTSALADKVDKVTGKGLSTNDYDNTAKGIVDGISTALDGKVDKVTGKSLSSNDYTNADKAIVDGVPTALNGKVDKIPDKGLSTNDYTNAEKLKLATLENYDDTDLTDRVSDVEDSLTGKADKVTNATNGNLAGLDSNGNLTDSGKSKLATIPSGGTTGQVLKKKSGTNYDTEWEALATSKGSATKGVYFDANGAVQEMSYTVGKSVPSDAVFTDTNTKVTQTNTTGSADYRLVLSTNANDTTETNTARKSTNFKANPSTGVLSTPKVKISKSANALITGSGTAGSDKGSGVSPRYYPAKWTFNLGGNPDNGDIITIKIPVAGGTYSEWLSTDNGTTYHPIALNGKSRITSQYAVNTFLTLIYESSGVCTTYALAGADTVTDVTGTWRVINYYDSNTTYSNMSQSEATTGTATTGRLITAKVLNDTISNKANGHTILNGSGSAMNQRTNLQFDGFEVSDNGAGDKTVVSNRKNFTIFAVHYSENNSSPDSCDYPVGYDNYGWTPMYVNLSTGEPVYGSWNLSGTNATKIRWLFPRSCMLKYDGTVDYYLDEDDETKKADGTASDVANTSYGGNAMMEWAQDDRTIYWKIVPDSDFKGWTFVVANAPYDKDGVLDDDMKPWNHYNCDGRVARHWYTPKYFGSLVSNVMRSLSGQTNCVNRNRTNENTYAEANNQTAKKLWGTETFGDLMFLQMMCCLVSKSTNSQAKFGYGRCNSNSTISPGNMNGKGMFFGKSDSTSGVKIFGMENPWGNIWRAVRGCLNVSGTQKVKLTYGTQDGSTVEGYNYDGSGYLTGGTYSGYSGVCISSMNIDDKFLIPKELSGSDSTYYTDAMVHASGTCYALIGGNYAHNKGCGIFCYHLGAANSVTASNVGASISCKPLA